MLNKEKLKKYLPALLIIILSGIIVVLPFQRPNNLNMEDSTKAKITIENPSLITNNQIIFGKSIPRLPQASSDSYFDKPTSSYVIITTNEIQQNSLLLDDFVQYKQSLGFNVIVITEDDFGFDTGKTEV